MTVREAAAVLHLTPRRVRVLIESGKLRAVKEGRDWRITKMALAQFADQPRRPGRPPRRIGDMSSEQVVEAFS